MKIIKNLPLLALFILFYANLNAQCSDAGACSIASNYNTDSTNHNKELLHSIGIDYSYSSSGKPANYKYNLIRLNGNYSIDETISVSAVIPFLSQSLNKKTTTGFGDLILSLEKIVGTFDNSVLTIIGGAKIPLSLVNKDNFGYLNGYGTFDLIAGAGCKFSNFNSSLLTQIPFTKYNDDYTEFKRGADLVFQLGYSYYLKEWSFNAGGLIIKRLAESEITEKVNSVETVAQITNSDFMQLNLTLSANYKLNDNLFFDLSTAVPILKRKENADGSKRAFTLQIGTQFILNKKSQKGK